jgi:hypothetical protein
MKTYSGTGNGEENKKRVAYFLTYISKAERGCRSNRNQPNYYE